MTDRFDEMARELAAFCVPSASCDLPLSPHAHAILIGAAESRIKAQLKAFDKAGQEAMREKAAKLVDPGEKPCGCCVQENGAWIWQCDCHNSGDLAEASSWCISMGDVERIRALPIEDTTP